MQRLRQRPLLCQCVSLSARHYSKAGEGLEVKERESGEEETTTTTTTEAAAPPQRRWDTRERRREFLLEAGKRLGLEGASASWAGVRPRQLRRLGGSGLLRSYNGSLRAALADLLPEAEACEGRRARGYWREEGKARAFLERLAAEKGVRRAEDWAAVSLEDVRARGGSALLREHSYSLRALLVAELPELRGQEHLLRPMRARRRWGVVEERRRFLREFAARRCLRSPSDWKAVTVEEVRREGGSGLLAAAGGLVQALAEAFPGEGFTAQSCRRHVPARHWDCREHRQSFLREVAKAHGVQRLEDWRRVRAQDIDDMGGQSLLRRFATSHALLCDAFPEMEELRVRECRPSSPSGFWQDEENVRAYVAEVGRRCNVANEEDWYRVSTRELRQTANPLGAMRWVDALRIAFPDVKWDEERLSTKAKKTTQRHLLHSVAAIFPHAHISQTPVQVLWSR